jgi:hypothetical protein
MVCVYRILVADLSEFPILYPLLPTESVPLVKDDFDLRSASLLG